ncbi:hypothetical protein EV127DRAFT_480690 [Xylaria flabelliformis]|nr:hypothetical protein EV127DRAFT_480690 [Xylaria flabelliformis]KAI0857002.1 hypothetical protein F4860DRAFT_518271 [Xylaria cubensis]
MDLFYNEQPADLKIVETPSFDVVKDKTGVLELEPVGPIIHPKYNGDFSFICRVQNSASGMVYAPRFGARLRATAYLTETAVRSGKTVGRGQNYRLPLKDGEKDTATAAHCSIAYKPTDSGNVKAGIYVSLNLTWVWYEPLYIYIELEWAPGFWTIQLDSKANYETPLIKPNEIGPALFSLQAHQDILKELDPYWLKLGEDDYNLVD